jgi:hypothetical protein
MTSVYCFSVAAEAGPSALARVLDVFTLYGHLPSQFMSRTGGPAADELAIDAQLEGISADTAAAVARRLGRVVGVCDVLYSEKRPYPEIRRCAA